MIKEHKATRYVQDMMFPYIVNAKRSDDPCFTKKDLKEAYLKGWDEALENILVDASKELPEYDIDVWVINENGEQFFCHRSKNKRVKAYKDEWCNYTGSDIIAWIRPVSFDEMLKLNKDVLKRLKDK